MNPQRTPQRRVRLGAFALALLAMPSAKIFAAPGAPGEPAASPLSQPSPVNEAEFLIQTMDQTLPRGPNYAAALGRRAVQLADGIERIDRLLAERPTHPRTDDLRRARLRATFELCTLRGEPLDSFAAQARELSSVSSRPDVAAAADYALLRIELESGNDPANHSPAPGRIPRMEQFIEAHPHDAAAPFLLCRLLDLAYTANDFAAADRWLARLMHDFPGDVRTAQRTGYDRLRRGIGEIWAPLLKAADGKVLDWQRLRGRPVVVVFGASYDDSTRQHLSRLGRATSAPARGPSPALVFISLDRCRSDAEEAGRVAASDALLFCDEKGWASPVATHWGIASLPTLLVLDRGGRLLAIVDGAADLAAEQVDAALKRGSD